MPNTNPKHFEQQQTWIGKASCGVRCGPRVILRNCLLYRRPINQVINLIEKISFSRAAGDIKI
jgi:hypothetical protein